MERTLQDRLPFMQRILEITRQPGVSIGVIFQGQEVLKHNFGVLDIATGQKCNSDTIYCIASLTKAFIAASLDLLVQEQMVSWDSTIASIIPEFKHVQQPEVFANMTLKDICSHRTGLTGLGEITQGLHGRILIEKKDVVAVCNALPSRFGFRTDFFYNNAMYALAACVIEKVSGNPNWGDFVEERLFKPLGMERSTAFSGVHNTDNNTATPYVIWSDGTPSKVPPTQLSADTMNGGSGGLRSSVNDLMKWCTCLLKSFREDTPAGNLVRHKSPIFERLSFGHRTLPEAGDYCAGWCRHQTPALLGAISPNRALESPLIGSASPSLVVYGHQGDVPGYTCNLYLIPQSDSAVVILSNATGLSDATDWIAQDIIQTMHNLEPAVDFLAVAARAASKFLSSYPKRIQGPLLENQVPGTTPPPRQDFLGSYTMEGLDIVSVDLDEDGYNPDQLLLTVNKQPDQVHRLWHYNYDVWCFLPDSWDKCLSYGQYNKNWAWFLISFVRDSAGRVTGLRWKMQGVDVNFHRIMDPRERNL